MKKTQNDLNLNEHEMIGSDIEDEQLQVPLNSNESIIENQVLDATKSRSMGLSLPSIVSIFNLIGRPYSNCLTARPIITKSVTTCLVFGLSDYCAQLIENRQKPKEIKSVNQRNLNLIRTLTSAAVGLLYFGPAAHYWYDWIFRIFPGTSLISTLKKAACGQLLFGPVFNCVFFAASLLQSNKFSFLNWAKKIGQDLPGAFVAGLGFWPIVDVISYKYIPVQWIPLFINFCSFIWTIYLSMVANNSNN